MTREEIELLARKEKLTCAAVHEQLKKLRTLDVPVDWAIQFVELNQNIRHEAAVIITLDSPAWTDLKWDYIRKKV